MTLSNLTGRPWVVTLDKLQVAVYDWPVLEYLDGRQVLPTWHHASLSIECRPSAVVRKQVKSQHRSRVERNQGGGGPRTHQSSKLMDNKAKEQMYSICMRLN